ncbi:MAG: response regulator transcription factor [Acidobacteriaceae bacterium]|nr:response regulator transcription factor [Acidobacteriaceae bacterium]
MSAGTAFIPQPTLPKVLLADDHHLILDALGAMMKSEFNVLAVDNSQAFIEAVDSFKPDVAILDVSMPGGDGFITARKVLERSPTLPIVFLSMYADSSYVDQAAQMGAKAYLSKRAPAQELMSAIHAVLEGETLLAPGARDGVASSQGTGARSELTARQREVLRLIAMGCSAKDIANQLNISVRTAEFHRAAIMQRLGLHSTAQMTRYAIANEIA